MSQVEDPTVTIMRLLRTQMRVILDSGALASIYVSGEYPNSDALKQGDGQVTVALADWIEQKLDLTGRNRRRTATLRVNVWATDMPNAQENGKSMRGKIVEEVNRIIRQNRTQPNLTTYSFIGLGPSTQGSKAYSGDTEAPPAATWTELSAVDYQNLWYTDDSRVQVSTADSDKHAVLLFGFKIDSHRAAVKEAFFMFEGYGSAPSGDGVTVKAWNNTLSEWQNPQSNSAGQSDATLTLPLSAGLTDFLDADGYLWFIAETTGTSDEDTAATLSCDTVSCTVKVNGATYCDVAGTRCLDRNDIKPPIYRTEFTVKTWLIENIGV